MRDRRSQVLLNDAGQHRLVRREADIPVLTCKDILVGALDPLYALGGMNELLEPGNVVEDVLGAGTSTCWWIDQWIRDVDRLTHILHVSVGVDLRGSSPKVAPRRVRLVGAGVLESFLCWWVHQFLLDLVHQVISLRFGIESLEE